MSVAASRGGGRGGMLARPVRQRVNRPWRPAPALALALALVGASAGAQPSPAPVEPDPALGRPTRPLSEALRVGGGRCWNGPSLVAAVRAWLKRDEVDARLAIDVRHLAGPPERVVFVVKRGAEPASERVFRDRPFAERMRRENGL